MKLINRFGTLIKRELAEHRKGVLYTPFIAAAIMFSLVLISAIWNGAFRVNDVAFTARMLQKMAEDPSDLKLMQVHQAWMFGFFVTFHIVSGVVTFAYLLACLFDERKDRSTLFWRSMPVNDWETVISKLVTAVIVIPLVAWIALMLMQILVVGLFTVLCWQNQLDANELVYSQLPFFRMQLWQLASLFGGVIWTLPVVGWLMLCSAYAKQRPILLAMLVPGVLMLAVFVLNWSKLLVWAIGGSDGLRDAFTEYFSRLGHLFIPFAGTSWQKSFDIAGAGMLQTGPIFSAIFSLQGMLGALIGLGLVGATIWVRRYRETAAV